MREGPEGTSSRPRRWREHAGQRGAAHIPLPPRLPPRLTEDSHPVEPSGLAHLVACYTLKLGRVLRARGCEEQGVGGQEPGMDRQTVGLRSDRPG